MTYKALKEEFDRVFPDAHFCANDGEDGVQELMAFIFDMVNQPEPSTPKRAGMSFEPMVMAAEAS